MNAITSNDKKKVFNPGDDITKIPDKTLVNLHTGGWRDKFSVQDKFSIIASIEMSRRLKNEIEKFNKQSSMYSKILVWLTIVMIIAVLFQIYLCLLK